MISISELAQRLGLPCRGDGSVSVAGIATLRDATERDLSFVVDRTYAEDWRRSPAAAAVVGPDFEPVDDRPLLVAPDVELATAELLAIFAPQVPGVPVGVDPSASVDGSAELGAGVAIGPQVTIAPGCRIGDGVVIHPGVHLYPGVEIGAGSVLHAGVVIRERCRIGRGVILHANVSIGADGFGYRPAPDGRGLVKMPHIGDVIIEDGVEIGANSCVDRAKTGSTLIGAGSKIDNLCQVAHNCRLGRCVVIAAGADIGGSVEIGDGALLGGGAAVKDHIRIGPGARIGGRSNVTRHVPAGEDWIGWPAGPAKSVLREWAAIRRLPGLIGGLTGRKMADPPEAP